MEHETYVVEHGATASIKYASCSCGWSGPPRRKAERYLADAVEHVARERVLAELTAYRAGISPQLESDPYNDR